MEALRKIKEDKMEVSQSEDEINCMEVETQNRQEGEKILGENDFFAYLKNESSAVDFFFKVVPSSDEEDFNKFIGKPW